MNLPYFVKIYFREWLKEMSLKFINFPAACSHDIRNSSLIIFIEMNCLALGLNTYIWKDITFQLINASKYRNPRLVISHRTWKTSPLRSLEAWICQKIKYSDADSEIIHIWK